MSAPSLENRVLSQQLLDAAETHSDAPFLTFGAVTTTFGEFDQIATRVASGLMTTNLARHGKLAIFARNSLEFVAFWFGCARIGALYVPINTDYKGAILQHQLTHAEVTHILIDPEFLDALADVIADLPLLKHVIVTGSAELPTVVTAQATVHFSSDLMCESARTISFMPRYSDGLAISFTSGTTGPSKGVLVDNAHVVAFALDWMRYLNFQPHERIYTPLPLFHAIGAWLGVVPSLINRSHITISPRFSASNYWNDVRAARADVAHGIFSMIPILMKQPERPEDASQPARAFYVGNQNPAFEERFKCRIVEVYGATETGIVAGTDYGAERVRHSCGKPNAETFEVAVMDEHDQIVPAGISGEIVVRPKRSFSMLREYYRNPEATIATFRNLWFHTGDNGRFDTEGNLFFIDRKKDTIRKRGENISSYELEFAVNQHPAILESAAVAVTSELGEDDVKMVVVLKEGATLSAPDFWLFCEEKLPRFWIPTLLEFRTELPKTGNHKVQKFLLKKFAGASLSYVRDARTGEIRTFVPAEMAGSSQTEAR
ncbi:AMP-binding protein [Sinorhizobium sp. GL28]|uniref:AMP-binding protein n=1 Tax=Sinorhizobium sp. GL28 TaxID=1358418 RepID=UPI00071C8A37|nr:AMP-binding protein [Sinorhizobium sp. GL28]KSV87250.1 hypothetical protein N184_31375 [Sinorhizobium sp. GL28]